MLMSEYHPHVNMTAEEKRAKAKAYTSWYKKNNREKINAYVRKYTAKKRAMEAATGGVPADLSVHATEIE